MTREFVENLKKNIIDRLQLVDVLPEHIGDDDALFGTGLGLDSIDAVELVGMLEKQYGIGLTDLKEAKAAFATVGTLARYISDHRSATGSKGVE